MGIYQRKEMKVINLKTCRACQGKFQLFLEIHLELQDQLQNNQTCSSSKLKANSNCGYYHQGNHKLF